MPNPPLLQLNAVSASCCSAVTIWFFPGAAELFKLFLQAMFVLGTGYLIMGKEHDLSWAELRGYRILKGVYLHFFVLGVVVLLQGVIPYVPTWPMGEPSIWVSY